MILQTPNSVLIEHSLNIDKTADGTMGQCWVTVHPQDPRPVRSADLHRWLDEVRGFLPGSHSNVI